MRCKFNANAVKVEETQLNKGAGGDASRNPAAVLLGELRANAPTVL